MYKNMNDINRRENDIRNAVLFILESFDLFSVVFFILRGEGERILLCLATVLLLLLPMAAERILRCRFSLPLYLLCMFYAIGAMLGHSWKFYYLFPGWDKLLHIIGGIVFAMLGIFLPCVIQGKALEHPLMTALFALCFSVAVSAVWEFFEYGMDHFFAMDMQNDTVVYSLHSYLLGNELGVLGSIEHIQDVSVNGKMLGLGGYLDIGLIDTMNDMILESLGALAYVLYYSLRGGRPQPIRPVMSNEKNGIHPRGASSQPPGQTVS